jgi:hypothetical protein
MLYWYITECKELSSHDDEIEVATKLYITIEQESEVF